MSAYSRGMYCIKVHSPSLSLEKGADILVPHWVVSIWAMECTIKLVHVFSYSKVKNDRPIDDDANRSTS